MKAYYDTNKTPDLPKENNNAISQQKLILKFFQENGGVRSPDEINLLVLPNSPITSIRRAMTNLTQAKLLIKTDHMVLGQYGKPVHTWKLNEGQMRML